MAYTYKMIQVPPTISVKQKDYQGREAASYLESVVNQQAGDDRQFFIGEDYP